MKKKEILINRLNTLTETEIIEFIDYVFQTNQEEELIFQPVPRTETESSDTTPV